MTLSAPERAGIEEMVLADIYVLQRGQLSAVLAPDSDNIPTLCDPQPHVTCFECLPLGFGEAQLVSARGRLGDARCHLVLALPCPDGPPYRSGRIFTFQRTFNGISWRGGSQSYNGGSAIGFIVATPQGTWQ